jgi:hydrogenase expression/formation protein HypC
MCLAIPGKVLEINGPTALVDFDGIKKKVTIALLPRAKVGSFVIVHAGCAIEELNEDAAKEALKVWKEALEIEPDARGDL